MKTAYINRGLSTDEGTFSVLACPEVNFTCWVAELPWKSNQSRMSCIPCDEYIVKPVKSPKFGLCFMVHDVENRHGILFHSGTWAGDTEKKFKTHSLGCILPGNKVATIDNQKAVVLSKNTTHRFMETMGMEPFKLIIL
jgi:hypothetical protein